MYYLKQQSQQSLKKEESEIVRKCPESPSQNAVAIKEMAVMAEVTVIAKKTKIDGNRADPTRRPAEKSPAQSSKERQQKYRQELTDDQREEVKRKDRARKGKN